MYSVYHTAYIYTWILDIIYLNKGTNTTNKNYVIRIYKIHHIYTSHTYQAKRKIVFCVVRVFLLCSVSVSLRRMFFFLFSFLFFFYFFRFIYICWNFVFYYGKKEGEKKKKCAFISLHIKRYLSLYLHIHKNENIFRW